MYVVIFKHDNGTSVLDDVTSHQPTAIKAVESYVQHKTFWTGHKFSNAYLCKVVEKLQC
jgi:hypothetical protein